MRKRRFTPKERALIKAVVKDPDATSDELAVQSGYAHGSAVRKMLKSPNVKARITELMDSRPKLKDIALIKKLEEGLEANRNSPADYKTRKTYLDLAFTLKGHKVPTGDAENQGSQVMVNIYAALARAQAKGIIETEVIPQRTEPA